MNNWKIEIKWALIFIIVTLLWMLFEKLLGLHDVHIDKHATYTNFVAIPAILVYVLALLDKKKNFYDGYMPFKQAFMCGMVLTLIVTLFTPLTQYIISNFISPDFFENAKSYAVSQGKLTESEASDYFNLRTYILIGAIGTLIMGTVTSFLVAIFVRSKYLRKDSDRESSMGN
jgi:hypothetical protein